MDIKLFSLVIPSYKQEKKIVSDIKYLSKTLSKLPYDYEIVVVIDGMVDQTYQNLKKANLKKIKIIKYTKNQGKGFAVKKGMLNARGDVIGFLDAGRDINPRALSIALDLMELHNADIVLGSKLHPDSEVNYPPIRHIISFGYRTIIKILFDLNVKDTQVGLKLFKRKVARNVFRRIIIKRFAFDVEVLAVAQLLGYDKIYESPITLNFKMGSITNTNFWEASFWVFWDTLAIFYRKNILRYYSKKKRK